MTSDTIDKIAPALLAAQKALRPVKQTASNPHFKSKFAPLSEVMDASKEALHANGIAVLQSTSDEDSAGFNLVTTLIHTSGQWIASRVRMPLEKGTAQGAGSGITYGRRYGLATMLGIVAEEDDDGHAASQRPQPKPKPQGATKPIEEWTDVELQGARGRAATAGNQQRVDKIDEELERRRLEA